MNLIGFIIPNHSNKISLLTHRHFVQIQNEQYLSNTKRTLFERFMYIKDKKVRDKFFEIPFCLLEELDEIHDIQSQTEIDKLLLLLDVQNNKAEIPQDGDVAAIIEENESDKQKKFEYEYDFNKLLRYSLKYWQLGSEKFEIYKDKLLSMKDPMFTMIIQIIEGQEDEFKNSFYSNVQIIFNQYIERYQTRDENERLLQEDMFFLFRCAIKHGRDPIVAFILNYETFETLKFEFPRHNRATKHCFFAARKLLDHGYELSHEGLPPYWITEPVLEDFPIS